jgi:hypothetical protein
MPYVKRKLPKHTKLYLETLGYDLEDPGQYVPSELGPAKKAADIHHIIGRGKCGEDRIENLMALTRQEHIDYGDKNIHMGTLLLAHRTFLKERNIEFDNEWFENNLKKYTQEMGS